MEPTEDIDPTRILHDAVDKHHLDVDPADPRLKALVSYAVSVGYNIGWHDHKNLIAIPSPDECLCQKCHLTGTNRCEKRD